jgi:glycosyltransferase involved in cell wall biosynthesis
VDAPALLADLKRVIDMEQPDLIHAGPIQTAAWLAARTGFHPLVGMSWGSDLLRDADRNDRWRRITALTLARTDILVGDCQAVRLKAAAFGFPPERTVIFPWGVDLEHFVPLGTGWKLRDRLGWDEKFILLSVRSWEPLYGVDLVARAFAQACRSDGDRLRLILLGAGSQDGAIRDILADGGVIDKVHFGGQVGYDNLPQYYQACDLYLSASHSDGSSVSLLEAMACGRPTLVSDIPGNREWVQPGRNGWLFPDNDVDALMRGMLYAADHPMDLIGMDRANTRVAKTRADWKKNFNELLLAYEKAGAAK